MFQHHGNPQGQPIPGQPIQNQQQNTLPPLLQPGRLTELVIAGTGHQEKLEPAVEHALNKIAEEFLDEIVASAAELATHRGSSVIDVQDVLFPLERFYDLGVAGFVDIENGPRVSEGRYRQLMLGTDAHQMRKQQVTRQSQK